MKHNNIHVIRIPEGEEEEEGMENLFKKVMTQNFPNLIREKNHTNPGSREGPNPEELKEAHSKTHHN